MVVKKICRSISTKSVRKQLTKFVERCGCTILDRFFSILGVESFFVPFYDIWKIRRISRFFRDHLQISSSELQIMSWDKVVGKMRDLHERGQRVQLTEEPPPPMISQCGS